MINPDNNLNHFLTFSAVDSWRVIEIQSSLENIGTKRFFAKIK